jgi:uncharacterized protein with PIN domain
MAVPCAGCGRQYDVTLFEFGRTIWCTCGRRVGMQARVRDLGKTAERRFIADVMLAKVARWLRLLGLDCSHEHDIGDADLVRRAIEEARIVLTCDRRLAEEWTQPTIYVVRAQSTRDQIVDVVRHFALTDSVRIFTRCSRCNRPVVAAQREAVAGRVPERVLATHDLFFVCAQCGRTYWEGSHTERMRRAVDSILKQV